MQRNNINFYINKKLEEISKNNQLRKIFDVHRKSNNKITYNNKELISSVKKFLEQIN